MTDDLSQLIEEEKAKILAQTALIDWPALEKFYAQGKIILVDQSVNLVDVAYHLTLNNDDVIEQLISAELLTREFNPQAKRWHETQQQVWCVVIKPWVLVQATKD